ncbi:MAG TPA: hypothetical protein VK668_10455 [Mucilaginibacter sp.]|nr:hypothetical protein [Mucilaginibacter sp.]
MAKLEIEISSKAIEKGIDLAKAFLEKLIGPAVEETGLLLKEGVALWRFRNQVSIVNKAKTYCERHNIESKQISLKLLCPLLEYASLEEEEVLQDKWAVLLGNMVDSKQNIDNHVFPYILSQVSLEEFLFLGNVFEERQLRVQKWTEMLEKFRDERPLNETSIYTHLLPLKEELEKRTQTNLLFPHQYLPTHNLSGEIYQLEKGLKDLQSKEQMMVSKIKEPQSVSPKGLKEYQLSNLIRLGLIKVILRPYTNTHTLEIPNNPDDDYLVVDFDMEIESDLEEHSLTELGELFIKSCNEKSLDSVV